MKLRLLLIGYGAIGGHVYRYLTNHNEIEEIFVLVRLGRREAAQDALGVDTKIVHSVNELNESPDLSLECAGHTGLKEHGCAILTAGVPLGVVSIGALADPDLSSLLEKAAAAGRTKMTILPGAIGAIDALSAARRGGLTDVVYTGSKPAIAWVGTAAEEVCDLSSLSAPVTLFEGPAGEAARRYPKNANVAATIALAGLGLERTLVRLVADPNAQGNRHEIEARGAFGEFRFSILGNALPESPRSSALTAMSALRFVENHIGRMAI